MLKSLEVFGFKSFADRLLFEFSPGITAVVGPNGSGKSNVVDSIKWILGDQSAKSLRGKDMSDVIFNGATGRKSSSFAEATITFKNDNGFLPVELPEVSVGRRLWNTGDAEYLINGNAARLKDVRALFMGTGAGASAYAIIEQGRVDQILQANATNRRLVFEEAAGISRFKARKNEALRKLERVDQNLLRLKDIVEELETQLRLLRNQAEKAAQYRDLSQELKRWWLGLAADDYRYLTKQLEEQNHDSNTDTDQTEELTARQEQVEQELTELESQITSLEADLRTLEGHSTSNRETIASHQATIKHQSASQEELETELIQLRQQLALLENRSQEARAELDRTQNVLTNYEAEYQQSQDERENRGGEIERLSHAVAERRQEVLAIRETLLEEMRTVADAQSQMKSVAAQKETFEATHQSLEEQALEWKGKFSQCEQRCASSRAVLEAAEERVRIAEAAADEFRLQTRSLENLLQQSQEALAEERERRSAWKAQIQVIEDLEARQDGLSIGVQEILERAKSAPYPPWNRILGSVADLLQVDIEHAALLEIALGPRTQLLVIQEYGPLLEYLMSGTAKIAGRVGFVAVSDDFTPLAIAPGTFSDVANIFEPFSQRKDLPDLSADPRVIVRADHLPHANSQVPKLAEYLLADTWIVDRLETAVELSRTSGHGCRFVTLQGELWESDGRVYVGTLRNEPAVVSRKSELRQLKNDLLRLESQIRRDEEELTELEASVQETTAQMRTRISELESAQRELHQAQQSDQQHQNELAQLQNEQELLARQYVQLTEKEEQQAADLKAAEDHLSQAETRLAELQKTLEEAEAAVAHDENELQTAEQKRSVDQLELAKTEERWNNLRQSVNRLTEDVEQRDQQREEAKRRLELGEKKHKQINLQILNSQGILADCTVKKEALETQQQSQQTTLQGFRDQREKLTAEETRIRKTLQKLEEKHHQAEMHLRDVNHQLETLEERIQEEYQLTLQEVVDSGASAYELFLEELAATEDAHDSEDTPSENEDRTHNEFVELGEVPEAPYVDINAVDELASHKESAHESSAQPSWEEVREEIDSRVNRLRRKLRSLGSVNTESLRDLDELETRFMRLSDQLQDLIEAKQALEDIVKKVNTESKRLFAETFDSIRSNFQELFRKLFGGGEGDIILEDPDDMLDCGIEIVARPPGKELRSLSLLSGGEKTMTAVGLLLAIFKSKPSPFCILDEVDAALDDANISRFVNVLKEFLETTQFIMITHRKPSMTVADVIYGITMEQSGVSKKMSVRFEDIQDDGEFANTADDKRAA